MSTNVIPATAWNALGAHFSVPFAVRALPHAEIVWLNARWWRKQGWQLSDASSRETLERWLLASFGVVAADKSNPDQLLADRYGGSFGTWHGGSGRSGYRGEYNAKGIGRTPLVPIYTQGDHGDGRLSMAEAIREAIGAELAEAELPHGGVPIVAIIASNDEDAGEAILVRPNVLRPAHFERSVFFGSAGTPGSDQACDALRTSDAVRAAEQDPGFAFPGLDQMLARFAEQIGALHAHRLWQGRFLTGNAAVDGALLDFGSFRSVPSWRRYFGRAEEVFGGEPAYLATAAASLHASFAKYGSRQRAQIPTLAEVNASSAACRAGFVHALSEVFPLNGLSFSQVAATLLGYFDHQQRSLVQIGYRSNWRLPWIHDALIGLSSSAREERLLTSLSDIVPHTSHPAFWSALTRWTCPRPDLYHERTAIAFKRLARTMARNPSRRPMTLARTIDEVLSRTRRHFRDLPRDFIIDGQLCQLETTILYGRVPGGPYEALFADTQVRGSWRRIPCPGDAARTGFTALIDKRASFLPAAAFLYPHAPDARSSRHMEVAHG